MDSLKNGITVQITNGIDSPSSEVKNATTNGKANFEKVEATTQVIGGEQRIEHISGNNSVEEHGTKNVDYDIKTEYEQSSQLAQNYSNVKDEKADQVNEVSEMVPKAPIVETEEPFEKSTDRLKTECQQFSEVSQNGSNVKDEKADQVSDESKMVNNPPIIVVTEEPFEKSADSTIEVETTKDSSELKSVFQRVRRILVELKSAETIQKLMKDTSEESKKMRKLILDLCEETEDTLQLLEEAEKTIKLVDESGKILLALQKSLRACKEKMATRDIKISENFEAAIGDSILKIEKLTTKVPNRLMETSKSIEDLTISLEAETFSASNDSESRLPFFQRVGYAVRKRAESFCIVCACSVCLLCLVICSKRK